MSKDVDLLSYWMPFLRNLKEFKEIAKAEEPEIRMLLEAVDRTLNNMFIDTADERGIARYEELLNITPEEGDTLDMRRFKVISKWSDRGVYTKDAIHEMLTSYCGKDNFEIIEKYEDFIIEIVTSLPIYGSLEVVNDKLTSILPANMIIQFRNKLKSTARSPLYVAGVVSTSMSYEILQDSKITVEVPLNYAVVGSIVTTITVNTE
jgi:hypothetical protein